MTITVEPHVIGLKQALSTLAMVVAAVAVVAGLVVVLGLLDVVRLDLFWLVVLFGGGAGVAALAVVRWWLLARNGWSSSALGFRRPSARLAHLLWQVPLIFLAGVAVQGVFTTLVLDRSGAGPAETSSVIDEAVQGASPWSVVLLLVVLSVITPLWEESLFRGAFWSGFSRHLAAPWAILITAVLFAAVHAAPPAWPYLLTIGLGLTWLRWFHRNLWAPIVMHAVNNTLATLAVLAVT